MAAGLLGGCASSTSIGGGVGLDRFAGELRLEAEHRDETFVGTTRAATKENFFRENIKFDFDSHLYHPTLMTLGGVLDLGLEQRATKREGSNATVRTDNDNTQYDLSSMLLKTQPYSARLFAQRSQIRIRQSFFPTNEAVVTRHGATVLAKTWAVPSQLELARYTYEGRSGDVRTEHRDSARLSGSTYSDEFSLNYQADHQKVESELSGGNYDDNQAVLGSSWRFGEKLRNSLSIDGQFRDQDGDIVTEHSSLSGRGKFAITDDLESLTTVSRHESELGAIATTRTERTEGRTTLTHQLYTNLTSTVGADYMEQDFETGSTTRKGGDAGFQYRKGTPIGALRLGYGLAKSEQDEVGRMGGAITITDEPHVFTPGIPIFLGNSLVDQFSILVTDATGTIVYANPADYTVVQSGVTTRIDISVGSRIVPSQTILVSYVYRSSSSRAFETFSQSANLDIAFNDHISVGGYWLEVDQDLVSGTDASTLDQAREWGIHLHLTSQNQRLELEHIDRESLITPLQRTRMSWSGWFQPTARTGINASASLYRTEFGDQAGTDRGAAAITSMNWRPTPRWGFQLRAEYRYSDLRTETGDGVFFRGQMNYEYGKSLVTLELLRSQEDWDVSSDRDILRANLVVKRRF